MTRKEMLLASSSVAMALIAPSPGTLPVRTDVLI
jgi:hypothetical protein